jgi:thiamine biosynthesis lipoprotein
MLDTYVTIKLYDKRYEELLDGCLQLIRDYERMLSPYIEDSDISRLNAAKGQPVAVSAETLELLRRGIYYGELSNGLFDITLGGVSRLWDFNGGEDAELPDEAELTQALGHVGYKKLVITEDTAALTDASAAVDLGGIAKGYIADRAAEYLRAGGVGSAIINLGGNVVAIGGKPGGSGGDFAVGVARPFGDDAAAVLHVRDRAVVTSGSYQRYFYKNEVLYYHILDPMTGYPAETDLSGVTIVSGDSCDADALSTIAFMLGAQAGMALVESLEDTEAIFITENGEILETSGIGQFRSN